MLQWNTSFGLLEIKTRIYSDTVIGWEICESCFLLDVNDEFSFGDMHLGLEPKIGLR